MFASVLGVARDNAEVLKAALLREAAASDQFELRGDNSFGQVFVLRFPITTAAGTATVMSAWILRHGEDFPGLTACYIV